MDWCLRFGNGDAISSTGDGGGGSDFDRCAASRRTPVTNPYAKMAPHL